MLVSEERKEVLKILMKIKGNRLKEKLLDTKYENLENIVLKVSNVIDIEDLTDEQAKALEILLVLIGV